METKKDAGAPTGRRLGGIKGARGSVATAATRGGKEDASEQEMPWQVSGQRQVQRGEDQGGRGQAYTAAPPRRHQEARRLVARAAARGGKEVSAQGTTKSL